ncbi:hypothetical protein Cgig2_012520 [Carnegiea gigantea]|uniref:Uncharacterized protein n=1 Tax=Carnegiea gigantea TaxID=171969 RepID=A0A9Q1JP27_9CARY|nr:hypothetical protein Cgig2_012520 [Carnegiea gigantea]
MDVHATAIGDGGGVREIVMYVLWGGMVVQSAHGKVTYKGGSRKCMVVKGGMWVEEVIRMVKEIARTDMVMMSMAIVCGRERRSAEVSTGRVTVREEKVQACHDGKVYSKSARNSHDGVEVGWEDGHNQSGGKRWGSKLRVGGDTIELSKDDEISIVLENAGDEEATKQDDAGDEQSPEKGCDEGMKRKGCGDGNDMNNNDIKFRKGSGVGAQQWWMYDRATKLTHQSVTFLKDLHRFHTARSNSTSSTHMLRKR